MAAFTPAFTATLSQDGKTITFTDTSNWSNNDEGYDIVDFNRLLTITDVFDEFLYTIEFIDESLTSTYLLNANKWINAQFLIYGTPDFSLIQKFGFYRLFQLAYMEALKKDCGCCKGYKNMCEVDAFLQEAQWAIPVGNGLAFQEGIDSATAYLNS